MILLFYKVLFVVHITLAYPTHIVNKDYMDDVQCATEKKIQIDFLIKCTAFMLVGNF